MFPDSMYRLAAWYNIPLPDKVTSDEGAISTAFKDGCSFV